MMLHGTLAVLLLGTLISTGLIVSTAFAQNQTGTNATAGTEIKSYFDRMYISYV